MKKALAIAGILALSITPTASFAYHLEPKESEIGDNGNLEHTNLRGQSLSGADLTDANLTDADLSDADLSDADLSGADLSGADLEQINWWYTTCPDGTNSNDNGNTCENNL